MECYEMLGRLPLEGDKGRDQLNSFIKKVRLNGLSLDELVAAISAFKLIIANKERISPAYGSLLSHLFAQLEANWRGEAFNVDIRSVQLVLLKRILVGSTLSGNLVIWTAALKEIRMLSGQAKEFSVAWALEQCKSAGGSAGDDWPAIFHNLLSISPGPEVFEGLYSCLEGSTDDDKSGGKPLLDHLIFLIGQNGALGKSWIKWILSRGCLNISPLVFSGLLSLSQDIEYFNTLNEAVMTIIKIMWEIWVEVVKCEDVTMIGLCVDPEVYLEQVAGWIGSDCENGIRGALQLIENLKIDSLCEAFYLKLYQKHPFARRELLKKLRESFSSRGFWGKLVEIDAISLKEYANEAPVVMQMIVKDAPELICKVIDSEDQLDFEGVDDSVKLRALIEIDSILIQRAIKTSSNLRLNMIPSNIRASREVSSVDWKSITPVEVSLLKSQSSQSLVELCELLLLPGGIEEGLREDLVDLALQFVSSSPHYTTKEQLLMISKLTGTVNTLTLRGSYEKVFELLQSDLSKYNGTMKYLLERVSVESDALYLIIPKLPIDFHSLASRAICRFEGEIELRKEIVWLICEISGKVVSEPQLSKPLISLLSRRYRGSLARVPVSTFAELSDPVIIKAVLDFGFENEGVVEGLRGELIKSSLMFYGIIEDTSDGDGSASKSGGTSAGNSINNSAGNSINKSGAGNNVNKSAGNSATSTSSKFKNIHLNEKSINYALTALLNDLQKDLLIAHKLFKNHVTLFDKNPNAFLDIWVMRMGKEMFPGMTRGLISGKGAIKLHSLLSSFYDLCSKMLKRVMSVSTDCLSMKELMRIVGGQLNKQVYALIPLQQEKLQTILKQELNLKKTSKPTHSQSQSQASRSVTNLIFEMEKFEETLIGFLRGRSAGEGWSERIVRSTARDFKIKMEQL